MSKNKKTREDFEWRYQPVIGSEGYAVIKFFKQIKPSERSKQYLQPPLIAFWLPYAFQKTTCTEEQVKEAAWQSVYQIYHHLQRISQEFKLPLRVSLHHLNVESANSNSILEEFNQIKESPEGQDNRNFLALSDDAESFLQNFL
ncbi:hypothetical protein [Laspinema olomoucense]|uniref:hypothetical protein n=1 Tax=Laspinema olomoucense TaxID=3231600 RepID=UPI0021BBA1AE|nr:MULTISPECIES: hypothetical protein [unclassified Laspinema]MCT7975826.1 hypothetical protein [Laspinema sp. D3d]MCT7996565.1 hypothetical protein [Laspinema sp. D3c]